MEWYGQGVFTLSEGALLRVFFADRAVADGPIYLRLKRSIEDAIRTGALRAGDALPAERDIAADLRVSRVTVRRALREMAAEGRLVQRHGSGTFVAANIDRLEQSLSDLTSFSEDAARRNMTLVSRWLDSGVYNPSSQEAVILGLGLGEKVTRIARLRIANGNPLAIERAAIASSVLPDPGAVGTSLYAKLEENGARPVRALQRIAAVNLTAEDAALLEVCEGLACLRIERTSYLSSGRIVEFTRSIYRGDAYDFLAELRL